jgi:hypothetical protein
MPKRRGVGFVALLLPVSFDNQDAPLAPDVGESHIPCFFLTAFPKQATSGGFARSLRLDQKL